MSPSVRFLPAAEQELVAAIEWYEGHDPNRFRTWRVRRFPFLIVYRTAPELLVIAIAHTKRRPAYWARRTTRRA